MKSGPELKKLTTLQSPSNSRLEKLSSKGLFLNVSQG